MKRRGDTVNSERWTVDGDDTVILRQKAKESLPRKIETLPFAG
jgi:hypothetical protein